MPATRQHVVNNQPKLLAQHPNYSPSLGQRQRQRQHVCLLPWPMTCCSGRRQHDGGQIHSRKQQSTPNTSPKPQLPVLAITWLTPTTTRLIASVANADDTMVAQQLVAWDDADMSTRHQQSS
jgi:hypothetical protein